MTKLSRSAKVLRAPASLLNVLRFITQHPLNKKRKGRALFGYLKWQIGSRLVPGPVAFNWIADTRVLVHPGESGMTQNKMCIRDRLCSLGPYVLKIRTSRVSTL